MMLVKINSCKGFIVSLIFNNDETRKFIKKVGAVVVAKKLLFVDVKVFARWSLFASFCSLLVTFCSLFVSFCSLLVKFCCLVVSFCLLLVTFCSLLVSFCSLLVIFCSFFFFFYLLLDKKF